MVQMRAKKDMRTAIPSGQSVPFWIVQTSLDGLNFGLVSDPVTEAGIIITTTIRHIIFRVEPYELKLAIQRVGILEMQAWISIMKTVRRNVW